MDTVGWSDFSVQDTEQQEIRRCAELAPDAVLLVIPADLVPALSGPTPWSTGGYSPERHHSAFHLWRLSTTPDQRATH